MSFIASINGALRPKLSKVSTVVKGGVTGSLSVIGARNQRAKFVWGIGICSRNGARYTNLSLNAQDIFHRCKNNEVFAETESISDTYKALGDYRAP
jgi:hypothetical protein